MPSASALQERSDAFVFFGATGDLAFKQIFPALARLIHDDGWDVPIIGVARHGDVATLRDRAARSLSAGGQVHRPTLKRLQAALRFVNGSDEDPGTFAALRKELGSAKHPLHYLAIPPPLFEDAVESLGSSGCADGARVIVEKPFGRDLADAQRLNATLHSVFAENAIFRIDHYLGKEPVQNLLYFRFANRFLEPIWNSAHVDSVQVTMSEAFDVADRGNFYDQAGAIRDVVQNHILQVISILAMEPPSGHTTEALRNEKFKVLDSIRPLQPADIVRGQYDGYRQVTGVAPDSTVETYVALRLDVQTWRWGGVPFYVRTGKCLPVTATEVLVELKRPPQDVFVEIRHRQLELPAIPADAGHGHLARRKSQEAGRADGRRAGGAVRKPRNRRGAASVRAPDRRRGRRQSAALRSRGYGRGGLADRGPGTRREDGAVSLSGGHMGTARGRSTAP